MILGNKKNFPPGNQDTPDDFLMGRIKKALGEQDVIDFEDKLTHFIDKNRRIRNEYIRIAASVLILISLSGIVFHYFIPKNKKVFNEFYSPYNPENIAGIFRDSGSGKNQAIQSYIQGDYKAAVPLFSQYLKEYPDDIQAKFLLSISLIEEKRYGEAETRLTEILERDTVFFREEAAWYLVLIKINSGDYSSASLLLDTLVRSQSYSTPAKALQKEISGYADDQNKN